MTIRNPGIDDPFQAILQRESERANTTPSTATPGLIRLAMRSEPSRRQLPDVDRKFGKVAGELLDVLRSLVSGKRKWPLLLHGRAGRGKTLAALCLCDIAQTACYRTPEKLATEIVKGVVDWSWIRASDLAVLDELAMRTASKDLEYVAVKQFADIRDGRPTVYITNVAPKELAVVYDDRVFSRVACGTWFELSGDDRRMQ